MQDRLNLTGRVALVTGASSGLGKAIALHLAARGAAVAVNYHSGRERAEAVVAEISGMGGRAAAVGADVTDPAAVKRMYAEVVRALGPVDILVNNAGDFFAVHPFLETPPDLWQRSLDLNFKSAVWCSRAALPAMMERRWGRVIHISSIVARSGGPGETYPYAAAKGALETLTIGMAKEFAPHGVLVNAVSPGLIDTPVHDKFRARFERLAPTYAPVGRPGQPHEVAEVSPSSPRRRLAT